MRKERPPRCDIALLVDEETGEHRQSGRFVLDPGDVEQKVLRALRKRYRRVEVVPFLPTVAQTVERLRQLAPRVVFNLTEWVDGDRRMDAAIAGVLDMLKLRYTGTGPDGLRLARDKALSKRIVGGLSVAVPRSFGMNGSRVANERPDFPLVVKPQYGDGSDGIATRSVVRNARQLRAQIRKLRARKGEPAICEEFVPGRDLYVGLLGNEPRVLAPVEMVIRRGGAGPQLATYRLKNDPRYRSRWGVHYRRARLDRPTMSALATASRRIFHALKLRDYARLDFRLTPGGTLYFIEANPNPDLDPHALNRSGCFAGIEYGALIAHIVESARKRS